MLGALFPWTAAAQPSDDPVVVDLSVAYYDLPDTTLTGVVRRLNRTRLAGAGGVPSQGLTQYHIQPRWRPEGRTGRCRIADLRLEVTILITLPRWPVATARPVDERRSWRTIEAAVRTHELRHRDLTVEAARGLAARLQDLDAPGCRALDRAFAGEVALTEATLTEAHAEFDRSTPVRLTVGRAPGG